MQKLLLLYSLIQKGVVFVISILPCMLRLLPEISFLLISTLPVYSSTFFPKHLLSFSCVGCGQHRFLFFSAEYDRSPCSSLQTIDAGSYVESPRNINRRQDICNYFSGFAFRNCGNNLSCGLRKKKRDLWCNGLWNCALGDRLKFVFSPDVILCG